MLSAFFIRRPILATVCSLLIILAGAIAIPSLPIARYPDLTPPTVSVAPTVAYISFFISVNLPCRTQ